MIYIKLLLISMALFLAACDVDNRSVSGASQDNSDEPVAEAEEEETEPVEYILIPKPEEETEE